jgi:hypothetical protein
MENEMNVPTVMSASASPSLSPDARLNPQESNEDILARKVANIVLRTLNQEVTRQREIQGQRIQQIRRQNDITVALLVMLVAIILIQSAVINRVSQQVTKH